MNVVNIDEKLAKISDHWKPHVVGQVNDSAVKLVKFQGEFIWHHHENEDEMFLIVRGTMRIRIRDAAGERELRVHPGEFIIVPRMTDHMPIADDEVHAMLFEPATTLNTGNASDDARTIVDLPRL